MRLPDFMVIGAAKAGTTSLHHYLAQHPDIYMCPVKEPNFFVRNDPEVLQDSKVDTLEQYAALFADAGPDQVVGEVSIYLGSAGACQEIRETVPDVKLVISLRNPVDKAISAYYMNVRLGRETRPPEKALVPGKRPASAGLYYEKVKRYLDTFGRDQVHIVLFDDLKERPVDLVQSIFAFVGVDPTFVPDTTRRHNTASFPRHIWLSRLQGALQRSKRYWPVIPNWVREASHKIRERNAGAPLPEVGDEVRDRLREYYRDDLARLGELVGRDLTFWLSS